MQPGFYDLLLVATEEELERARALALRLDTDRMSGLEIEEAFRLRARLFRRARRTLLRGLLSSEID